MMAEIGQKLKDRYKVEENIGQGGFGITFKAKDENLEDDVVIKELQYNEQMPENMTKEKFIEQAKKEANSLISCRHENIVGFRDFFIHDGNPFIVMDYIPGNTLQKVVEKQGSLEEKKAIEYIQQIGDALKVVHGNNLLHRDIKPGNIILRDNSDKVVLIDFGIAREFDDTNKNKKMTIYYTPHYAPKEQSQGERQNPRSDLYALAATLYFLLTTKHPIDAKERINNQATLEEPKSYNSKISQKVNEAILEGMALEQAQRPSLEDWLKELTPPKSILPDFRIAEKAKKCFNFTSKLFLQNKKIIQQIFVGGSISIVVLFILPRCINENPTSPPPSPSPSPSTDNPITNITELLKNLEKYLIDNDWEKADNETYEILLKLAKAESQGFISFDYFTDISQDSPFCQNLQKIENLWYKESEGKHGFTRQQDILTAQGKWEKMFDAVKWGRLEDGELKYLVDRNTKDNFDYHSNRMQFKEGMEPNYNAPPPGHLPVTIGLVPPIEFFQFAKECQLKKPQLNDN